MKKKDLRTGYIVELRDGDCGLVLLGCPQGDILSDGHQSPHSDPLKRTWGGLDSWDLNLRWISTVFTEDNGKPQDADIVRVYDVPRNGNMMIAAFSLQGRDLLWEREDIEVQTCVEEPEERDF